MPIKPIGFQGNDLREVQPGDLDPSVLPDTVVTTDGAHPFTGPQAGIAPIADADLTTKQFVRQEAGAVSWQGQVLEQVAVLPGSPSIGDRYILTTDNSVNYWNGTDWESAAPQDGWILFDLDQSKFFLYLSAAWSDASTVIDHETLAGLLGGTAGEHYHLTAARHSTLTDSQAASLVLAAPLGGPGIPDWRLLDAADIQTGIFGPAQGGLGIDASASTGYAFWTAGVPAFSSTIPFSDISDAPDDFTPALHATTHESGGSDEIALDTAQITTGLLGLARGGTGAAGAVLPARYALISGALAGSSAAYRALVPDDITGSSAAGQVIRRNDTNTANVWSDGDVSLHVQSNGTEIATTSKLNFVSGFLVEDDDDNSRVNVTPDLTITTDVSAGVRKIFYSDDTGVIKELTLGATGTVLTSQGPTANPTFVAGASLTLVRGTNGNSNYVIPSSIGVAVTTATFTAPRAWTLPSAATFGAKLLVVADEFGGVTSTNTLTITRAGSDTISGITTKVINSAYGAVILMSDGVSKWTVENASAGGSSTLVRVTNGDSNYSIPATADVAAVSAALTSPRVWTLPNAATFGARKLTIIDEAGGVSAINNISINSSGFGQTISSISPFIFGPTRVLTLGKQYGHINLISNGVSNWVFEIPSYDNPSVVSMGDANLIVPVNTELVTLGAQFNATRTLTIPDPTEFGNNLLVISDDTGSLGSTQPPGNPGTFPLIIAVSGGAQIDGALSIAMSDTRSVIGLRPINGGWTTVFKNNGPLSQGVKSFDANYTTTNGDSFINVATGFTARTITLHTSSVTPGKIIIIRKGIGASPAVQIVNSPVAGLLTQGECITFYWNGTSWDVINRYSLGLPFDRFEGTAGGSVTFAELSLLTSSSQSRNIILANSNTFYTSVEAKISGIVTTQAVPGTLTIKFKIAGDVMVTTGAITPPASLTNAYWSVDVSARFTGAGSPASVDTSGVLTIVDSATDTMKSYSMTSASSATVTDTTNDMTVDLTAEWGSNVGNSIKRQNGAIKFYEA